MFTAEQYRAKASEYTELVGLTSGSDEAHEFRRLEQSFVELANNVQWMTDNHGKRVHATDLERSD